MAIEPWGYIRSDMQSAIVASTIAQVNASRGKRYRPTDFMPFLEQRGAAVDLESQERACEQMAMAYNERYEADIDNG
jgi:transposase